MKIELVSYLALEAGFNTDKLKADYFEIHVKTWRKKQKNNQLKKCEFDALRAKAGFLISQGWTDYRIREDRIYSPSGQFVTINEIENMWLYRQILSHWNDQNIVPDKRSKPLLKLL